MQSQQALQLSWAKTRKTKSNCLRMPELHDRILGTAPGNKIHHTLQQTGSRLFGDRLLASYLSSCLSIVDGLGPVHKFMLASEGLKLSASPELIKTQVAQADDNLRWAAEIKAEGYHRTNVLSFLSFWAAYEAGNENIIAAILSTIQPSALAVTEKFGQGKYVITNWPWAEDQCLEIAQKLDQKAKDKTQDGGWDVAARLTTLYGWLGVTITVPKPASEKFNEASMVRNVLLHRYGRLGQRDIARAPHLAEFENKAIQLTRPRLDEYYQAVVDVHIAIMHGITATGWE
jgi:hypothetical protein